MGQARDRGNPTGSSHRRPMESSRFASPDSAQGSPLIRRLLWMEANMKRIVWLLAAILAAVPLVPSPAGERRTARRNTPSARRLPPTDLAVLVDAGNRFGLDLYRALSKGPGNTVGSFADFVSWRHS